RSRCAKGIPMSVDATATYHGAQISSLVIISGSHHGRRILVPASGIVLGRGGEMASLFGDDSLVSREHARISLADDGSVQVEDLGSTNGTFINGIAIAVPSRLGGTDVLRIGAAEMRMTQDNAAGPPGGPSGSPFGARSGADLLAKGRAL